MNKIFLKSIKKSNCYYYLDSTQAYIELNDLFYRPLNSYNYFHIKTRKIVPFGHRDFFESHFKEIPYSKMLDLLYL